jgi:hypothetical protein
LALVLIGVWLGCAQAEPPKPAAPLRLLHVPGSTKKVCQLTGDLDRETGQPTLSRTNARARVIGTDLGSTFEHGGRLVFLFGDTWDRPGARDSLASTASRDPHRIELDFLRDNKGSWLSLDVPGVRLAEFEVPTHGVSIGGKMYVLFTTDHSQKKTMGRSVLAASADGGRHFRKLYDLSTTRFINVAFWQVDPWLYIFGSGDYRKSSVCLARVRQADIENKAAVEYFTGLSREGSPRWSKYEDDAVTLFSHNVVGELSVAYCGPLNQYVMLYNSTEPRGIVMRSAKEPWGKWSDATVIFDPWKDKGYGHFMHISEKSRPTADKLSDPGRDNEWGGEYGPFIMARYTTGEAGKCRIYFTMSTWNPYQVVVMQADLKLEPGPGASPK